MPGNKTETHPFTAFVPNNMQCLIVGSFPGREQTAAVPDETHWFYGAKRNQFWKILEEVYGVELKERKEKQTLFEKVGIGITDVIKTCIRTQESNLDEHLQIIDYNEEELKGIFKSYHPKILFTSRFVEKSFKKLFPDYKNTDILPSPSPRYFKLSIKDKAEIYRQKLPPITGL